MPPATLARIEERPLPGYPALREQVQDTLLLGLQRIEEAKVQTYWRTGKLINDHVERAKSADEHYGGKVLARLSQDLDISVRVLERCAQFARLMNISSAPTKSSPRLTWAHYCELITVKDERSRLAFLKRAESSGWTHRELRGKIQAELRPDEPPASYNSNGGPARTFPRLIPRRGDLYTYRLIELKALNGGDSKELCLDLGFAVRWTLPDPSARFKAGHTAFLSSKEAVPPEGRIMESVGEWPNFDVVPSKRDASRLFTYQADLERIVDGDTLIANIDLGFRSKVRQYLRLRGLDCPEMDTPEGRKARAFVVRELSRSGRIILTSSRSDKYDRYLADVFYEKGGREIFLNQLLLDQGLAGRM